MLSTFGVYALMGDNNTRHLALESICDIIEYLSLDIRIENGCAYFIRPEEEHDKHTRGDIHDDQYLINSILISGLVDGMTNEEFEPLRKVFEKVVQRVCSCLEQRLKLEGLLDTHEITIDRDSEGAEEGDEDVVISFVLKPFVKILFPESVH